VYEGFYYISDQTHSEVQVIKISTLDFQTPFSIKDNGGPFGLTVATFTNELWVSNGNSTVNIIDLTLSTSVGSVYTGGTKECDESCYSNHYGYVVVANPDDKTPFISFIDAVTRIVVKKMDFSDAKDGIELPICNTVDNLLYLTVPATTANSGGEVKVINMTSFSVVKVLPTANCNPRGGVFGNDGVTLLLACGNPDPLDYYNVQLDVSTGNVTKIYGVGEGDEVAYDTNQNIFFTTGVETTIPPYMVIGVIQGGSLLQRVKTTDTLVSTISHSIAVDSSTGYVFVPLVDGVGVYVASSNCLMISMTVTLFCILFQLFY